MSNKEYQKTEQLNSQFSGICIYQRCTFSVYGMLKKMGIPIFNYGDNQEFIQDYNLHSLSRISNGFTLSENGEHFIFYNEKLNHFQKEFTLAHELGHIFLGHTKLKHHTAQIEIEADLFAVFLLYVFIGWDKFF